MIMTKIYNHTGFIRQVGIINNIDQFYKRKCARPNADYAVEYKIIIINQDCFKVFFILCKMHFAINHEAKKYLKKNPEWIMILFYFLFSFCSSI